MPSITIAPISTLNGLVGGNQIFASGTTGTDFNISSTGSTHTFNIPDATLTARGLINIGTQTIAGQKVIEPTTATHIPLKLKGASSQSADWMTFTSSSDVIIGRFYRSNTNPGLGLTLYGGTTPQARGIIIDPGGDNTRPSLAGVGGFGIDINEVNIGEVRTKLAFTPTGNINAGRDCVWLYLYHGELTSDVAAHITHLHAGDAYSSATTYQDGGRLVLGAGNASTAANKTGTGGHVYIYGGAASPSGVAGDVLLAHTLTKGQGKVKVPVGVSASGLAIVGGRFYSNVSAVGNVGTGEDDLITANPIPASGLNVVGQSFIMKAWGSTANNANAKTVKLYAGGSVILTTSLTTGSANRWEAEAEVFRTGTDTQKYRSRLLESTLDTVDVENGTLTLNEDDPITCKITGEATDNNDIVCEGLTIDFMNY